MSAGSAQEQIPTRTRWVRLDDLLVDARRDDAVDVDRLRDVLEGLLPEALEDEVVAHALGRRPAHDDLPESLGEKTFKNVSQPIDPKSTRLNSSHSQISYA